MKKWHLFFALNLIFMPLKAAEPSTIPSQPLAKKGELLFTDDFESIAIDARWHKVVPSFTREEGLLRGSQTRNKTIPAKDGRKEVRPHAAVHGLELPTNDTIIECSIRFEGAHMIDIEFDDRSYTGAHYGHLSRAQFRLNGVTIIDERDGNMRNDIRAMRNDPSKKAVRDKLLKGRQITFPVKLEPDIWYQVRVETVADEMRVCIDNKPVAYLKSSGIGHATKSKIEFGVGGKNGSFDNLRIWQAKKSS